MDDAVEPAPAQALDQVTAALRADAADVATFTRVFVSTIGDALPAGMVEVERDRGMADRLAGREGVAVAVRISFPERVLELRVGKHGPEGEIHKVVRDVVLSRRQVGLDEWVRALAVELTSLAARDAAARAALEGLLGTG